MMNYLLTRALIVRSLRSAMTCGLCLVLSGAVACSRGSDKRAAQQKADSPAADMAGMDMGSTDSARQDSTRGGASAEVTLTAAQVQHGGILWEPVAVGTASAALTVPGQLVPNEDRTARLGATARGSIVAVRVLPGDRVVRDQLLVSLRSPEAGTAQSDLAKAEAEVSSRRAQSLYAKSARERAERLLTLKAIPRQDYERAVADDELARSQLVQADAELRRARGTAEQLGVGAATSGEVAVRSPIAGVVLTRTALPGTVVEAGAPLVVVTDPSTLWLTVDAPEKFASYFHKGGRLRFTVAAYPTDTFWSRVDAVGVGLDPSTRTLPIRSLVANGAGKLKPEMLASVLVEGSPAATAAVLPEDAVQLLDAKPIVFVAKPDGKGGATLTARQVEVASRSGGRVALSKGVSTGDLVVTRGAFAVKAQLKKGAMPQMEM
jgi:membrane fusion protein, heavy metal efflux system